LRGCSKEHSANGAATNEPCILDDKDAILTALGNTAQSETLVVVASTDEHGATVVEKRIREQLERSERLRHNCAFKVNSVGLKLPAGGRRLHRAGPLAAERSAFLDPGHHPDRA